MDIEEIWEQFGHQLKMFVASRVQNPDVADELTQELLIKSYENISSLKDKEHVDAWLFRIARNTINDYYRKKMEGKEITLADIENLVESLEYDSSTDLTRVELSHCIQPFIDQLPEKYKQAIMAVDLEGYSQKSVAEQLGVSYSTIKSQTQRGRAKLKKLFKQCCDFTIDARGNVVDYKPKSEQCGCDCD